MREKGRRKKGRTWAEAAKTVSGRERRGRPRGFCPLAARRSQRKGGHWPSDPAEGAQNRAERAASSVGGRDPGSGMEAPAEGGRRGLWLPPASAMSSLGVSRLPLGSRRSHPLWGRPRPARGSLLCLHSNRFLSLVRPKSPHWMQIGEACAYAWPRKEEGSAGAWQNLLAIADMPSGPGPLLVWASRFDVSSRGSCFCLLLELKVQEVFRNEVTGGTCRIFFFCFRRDLV